jgi:hypothetical protein
LLVRKRDYPLPARIAGLERRGISEIDEYKINHAIRDCLDHCRGANDPITQIAAYLAGLKASGNWAKPEVRTVELGVLRILQAIADTARIPKDDTVPELDQ